MQPIFYRRDFKWFIRTKWKMILIVLLLLGIFGVTVWLLFTSKNPIDKSNLIFVREVIQNAK